MKAMRILITGAAGFIGSHVSEYYIGRGHDVTGIDNFDNFYSRSFKEYNLRQLKKSSSFRLCEGDIRDRNMMDKLFSGGPFDLVIHLAAKAGVRPSIESIEEYYDVNVNGTLILLEVMRKHGVKKMLFASSSSVYGNNAKLPFSESDSVDNPVSPYASTKKSGELLCHVYFSLYGFDITCLRFFTVYGPRQRPDLAIHKFIRFIDEGNSIPFYGDGSTSRDYTYIDDIISGISRAANKLKGYNIYNLGGSQRISLRDLVRIIEEELDIKAKINHLPVQPGDVRETFADISKAKSELGYDPKFDFRTGIKQFIKWYKNNKGLTN